jgi:hypothetical protein
VTGHGGFGAGGLTVGQDVAMTENQDNPTDDLLVAAVEGIAQADPALAGSIR